MKAKPLVAVLPLVLVAVLGIEVYLAATTTYLPGDPGFEVQATVGPTNARGAGGIPPIGRPVEFVVLGDSTVMGIGSPTPEQSLPVLVANRVASRLGRPVHVSAMGASGARTATVLERQVPLLEASGTDVVLVVVGANDVTHVTAPWTMRRQSTALVEAARKAGRAPVVIGGIPQFRTVPALLQPLRWVTGRYASVLREVQRQAAIQTGAAYVDIAALASPRFLGRPESMSSDGYHPSPVGYGFWADALAPAVAGALVPMDLGGCAAGGSLLASTGGAACPPVNSTDCKGAGNVGGQQHEQHRGWRLVRDRREGARPGHGPRAVDQSGGRRGTEPHLQARRWRVRHRSADRGDPERPR